MKPIEFSALNRKRRDKLTILCPQTSVEYEVEAQSGGRCVSCAEQGTEVEKDRVTTKLCGC